MAFSYRQVGLDFHQLRPRSLLTDEDAQEIRSADKDLRPLWPPFLLAQEVGKGLERGALLLRQMSELQVKTIAYPEVCSDYRKKFESH